MLNHPEPSGSGHAEPYQLRIGMARMSKMRNRRGGEGRGKRGRERERGREGEEKAEETVGGGWRAAYAGGAQDGVNWSPPMASVAL